MILDLLAIEEDERFVVVAPHPDDESLGAGGVLLAHPGQADVFVVSDGGLADPAVPPEHMAATLEPIKSSRFFETSPVFATYNG